MADFSIGDTVRLKSGGPLMTVEKTFSLEDGETRVRCKWFDDKNQSHAEAFVPGMLVGDDDAPVIV